MNSTTRSRTARRKSGKRAASFVLKRSKPLYKLEQSTKSRFMRLCGLDWLKEKFSCCKKAVLESPSGSLKDVRLPTAYMNTKLKQTFSGAYRTDSDKIKPKRVGDFRKTLVIELNDLLVYFQPKDHEPALIELIKDKTVSNVEPHPINLLDKPNNEVVEVEPIFRDDLPNFLKELNDFYEIILWTTMPKKVMETIMSHIDPYNYAIVKLYADRCKPIILGDKLKTTILTRDLNILKRPLSSIVVLDVNPLSNTGFMSNTYLMSPFTGDFFDKSLEDLIQPLQAVSNLKDVRSVGLNINDYLNNLDRLGKIDLDQPTPLMPESQTGKKYARGFSAVDLYSKNIGTTRRTPTHRPPSILIPSLVIVQDEIPEDGDVLPYEGMKPNIFQANRLSDLHKTANFVKTEAKGDVAIRINSKSKYVNTAANSQNNVASIDQVAKFDKNQMVPSHAKESYLDEPSSAFRNKMMNPNLNLNRMGIFEEVCGGDELTRGNRKGRNNSNISEKKAGFEGFSATLVKLRLQSNNEIEELFLRMNSTARQLMQ